MARGRAFLAAALVVTLVACGDATGPDHALTLARARWAQRGPASYSFTVARWCECLEVGPVLVTVRNGVVESRHYTRDGTAVPSTYADLFPSVQGLFERVVAARRDAGTWLSVTYDPTFGYPARIVINPYASSVDDEYIYEAKDLLPR